MADQELSREERILRVMKRVLTDVAKDTYTRPGYRHPLSDDTVQGIRECLSLISAREIELPVGLFGFTTTTAATRRPADATRSAASSTRLAWTVQRSSAGRR